MHGAVRSCATSRSINSGPLSPISHRLFSLTTPDPQWQEKYDHNTLNRVNICVLFWFTKEAQENVFEGTDQIFGIQLCFKCWKFSCFYCFTHIFVTSSDLDHWVLAHRGLGQMDGSEVWSIGLWWTNQQLGYRWCTLHHLQWKQRLRYRGSLSQLMTLWSSGRRSLGRSIRAIYSSDMPQETEWRCPNSGF